MPDPKTLQDLIDQTSKKQADKDPTPKASNIKELGKIPSEFATPYGRPTGYGELKGISSGLVRGEDYFLRRAKEQSTAGQIAKTVANLPINIGAGILENAGYLGELAGYGMKELTDQEYKKDFTNSLTEFAQGLRDPFGEVYRETQDVFDFDDPAWWLQNGGGLVESIAEFAISGAGVGKAVGSGARMLSKTLNNTMKASRSTRAVNAGLNIGAQGITSGTLGYLEGAITGAEVYKDAINQGLSIEDASEAAATTVKWNTALIGALNVTSMYPLFKSRNLLGRAEKFGLTRKAGESSREFAERMAKAQTNPSKATRGLYARFAIPLEMGQEAIEEVTNLWAEVKGKQKAGIADTDATGMELFAELLKSEEGVLSAVLGALGGAGQTVAINRIPFNRQAITTAEGEQELRWLSNKQLNDMQDERTGIKYAEALEKDIKEVISAQEELRGAIDANDEYGIRRAQNKLFNISAKRSIPIDGGEAVKASLRELIEMDNETDLGAEMQAEILKLEQQLNTMPGADPSEISAIQDRIDELEQGASQLAGVSPAMQLGITDSMDNNEFKETAREKLSEVDEMREEYLNTIDQYNYGDERAFNMGEYVFNIKQRRKIAKDNLDYINSEIAIQEAEIQSLQEDLLPDELKTGEGYQNIITLASERTALEENLKEAKEEKKKLNTEYSLLSEKYGTQTKKELKEVLDNSIEQTESKLADINDKMSSYTPELIAEFKANQPANSRLKDAYKSRDKEQKTFKTLTRRLGYVESAKGREDFIKNAYNAHRSEVAKQEELKRKAEQRKAREQEKADIEAERAKKEQEKEQKKQERKTEDSENPTIKDLSEKEAPVLATGSTSQTEADQDVLDVSEDDGSDVIEDNDLQNPTDEPLDSANLHEEITEVYRKKTSESNKIQYGPSQDYFEVEHKGQVQKVTDTNKKNAPVFPLIETKRSGELNGMDIIIETDYEYEGQIYDDNDRERDITEEDFEDIYNRPVKITTKDGNLIGYVPTLRWISRQDKSGNYVNVAEFNISEDEDAYVSNADYQIQKLKQIREAIAEKDAPVNTKINNSSLGATIWNRDNAGNRKKGKASDLLPDTEINFAVVKAGVLHFPSGAIESKAREGAVFAQFPNISAPSPMWIDSVDVDTSRTIIKAIEAKVNNNEDVINEFAEVTGDIAGGFDFKANDGLYNLLSRKVFLESFSKESIKDYDGNRIVFNVDNRSGYVYLTRVNDNLIYTTNPKLVQEEGYAPLVLNGKVVEEAAEYIENLSNNLNRDLFNGTDQYQEIIYTDKVDTRSHSSYNEYAKTKLSTYIDGRNTINHGTTEDPDLEYLYYQNPVVTFDTDFLNKQKVSVKEEVNEEKEESTTKPKKPKGRSLFDLAEDNLEISDKTVLPDTNEDQEFGFAAFSEDELSRKLSEAQIAGFSNEQIAEITDVIVFAVGSEIRSDSDRTVQEIKDEVYELFDATQQQYLFNGDTERASRFNKILANWDSLYELAQNHLETVIGYERQLDDRLTGEEADFEKRKFDSKARWYENSKDTASSDLKMFLSSIPKQKWVERDGEKVKVTETSEYLGFQKFVPLDEIYDKLTQLLVNKEPTIENFKDILAKQGGSYVPFSSVLKRLDELPDSSKIESEFVKVMSKQYIDLIVSLFEPAFNQQGDPIGFTFKPIHSDRNSATEMIFGSWINAMKQSDLVKEIDGELKIDPKKASEIKKQYIEELGDQKPLKAKQAIKNLLGNLGIKLSESTWDQALQHNAKAFSKGGVFNAEFGIVDGKPRPNTFLGLLFDTLPDEGDEPTSFEIDNPVAGSNMRSRFKRLAFFELNNSDKVYTDSFTDINGNIIYPYQMNTHYSTKLRELKSNKELIEDMKKLSFSKFSEWLDQIDEVELQFIDGLRDQITKVGLSGENLGKMDADILASIMYFGTVNQTRGEKARFQTLTKSDKTTYPILLAPRHDVKLTLNNEGEVDKLLFDTRKRIKKIIEAEFARIYKFRTKIKSQLEKSGIEIEGYSEGADKFLLLPQLNAEIAESYIGEVISQEEYRKVWSGDIASLRASDENYANAIDIMYKIIEHSLLEESKQLKQRWEDSGLLEPGTEYIDSGYLRYQAKGYSNENAITYAATDFTINHFIAMSEEMMLISGDPAQFWKEGDDLISSIKATHENMSKRLAKDIAPLSDGNYRENERSFSLAVIQDSIQASKERKELGEAYKKMKVTDAQEYTTVKEALTVARAEGAISPADFNELMEVVNNPDENGYYEFSPEQLDTLTNAINPMKPVYTGSRVIPSYDVNLTSYIKSSSFPLIPQMLKGYELDKLRRYMEDSNIDRVPYQTASKLGTINPVKVFKGRNIVDSNPFTDDSIVSLDRSGFGIQQEVPVKDKKEINVLSQANKLLFLGIRDITGFSFEGNEYKGSELERIKEDIRIALVKSSEKQLKDRLGIELDESNNFKFSDLSKVRDILLEEAKERGWSVNAIESIELNEGGTGFEIPLALSPNSTSIESLILSLVSNITLGIKMDGYSYVQGSSAGIKTVDEIDTSSIIPTRKFDEEGLKFIEKKDGKTQPAQVLIPWNFKDDDGNTLNIDEFTDNEGYIIDDKLPEEARRMIGARIPTQGHNSMLPLEVVGFLPAQMANLIIVPEEIVAQMGSDFDVDKLYTYQYNLSYHSKKGLTKKEDKLSNYEVDPEAEDVSTTPVIPENNPYANVPDEVLKQKYLEIFESVYSHEALFDKLKSPLDKPDLGNERDLIREKMEEGKQITSPASYINQIDYRLNQRSGQQLVGIFALANTMNSLLERVDQDINFRMIDKEGDSIPVSISVNVDGKDIELTKLSGTASINYNKENRSKADNISLALSAAVDNANENILGNINWNRTTAGVVATLLMSQSENFQTVNLSWVARFTSQPIIRRLVEKVEQLESTTSDVSPSQRVFTAISEVKKEYRGLKETDEGTIENLSEKDLLNMIGKSIDNITETEIDKQLFVLEQFETLHAIAEDLRDLQQIVLSPATSGIDNTVVDAIESISDYNNVYQGFDTLSNTNSLLETQDGKVTEQGITTEVIYGTADKLIRALLPEYTFVYTPLLRASNNMDLNINSTKNRKALWKGAKQFLISNTLSEEVDSLYEERRRLIFEDDIAKRVLDAQDTWGKENYFLKRLQVELTEKPGKEPSRLRFSADKAIRLDDLKNSMAIRSMIKSEDEKERKLGRDLVLYDLISGGVQGARNFSKYIPPAYLTFLGLEHVKDSTMFDSYGSDIIKQILQNNPKLAPIFESTQNGVTLKGDNIHIVTDIAETVLDPESISYISMWLKDEGQWGIFRFAGNTKTGYAFERVPNLGWKDLAEYYPNVLDAKSVFNDRTDPMTAVPKREQEGKTKSHNDLDSKGMEALSLFLSQEAIESGTDLFSNILSQDLGKPYNDMAKFLKEHVGSDTVFRIQSNLGNNRPAKFVLKEDGANEVLVDPTMILNTSASPQEIILHEAVHAATVTALKDKSMRQVQQLEALRLKVKRELGIKSNYTLDSLEEFVASAMTDTAFQQELNKIPFNNKTAFQRFMDIITSLVESIADNMGVAVKKDSALESTIVNVVELIKDNIGGPIVLGEGSPFEFGFASFYNQRKDPVIEQSIEVLKTRITTVKKNMSGGDRSTKKYQQLLNTLNRLEEDLQTLKDENSASAILKVVNNQAKWVDTMLSDDSISDSLFFTVKNVVESWDYENVTKEFLPYQLQSRDNPMRSALREASEIMSDKKDLLDKKLVKRVKDYINKDLPEDAQIVTKDLKFMEDIGFSQEWLMDISTVDNQLAQYIYNIITTASRSASDELLEFDTRLSKLIEGIKDFSVFKQKDEEGNFTGNFIDEYSEKYQIKKQGIVKDLYKDLRSADGKPESLKSQIINKAIRDYHKAINEIEEVVDVRIFMIDNFASPLWKSKREYKEYLMEEYGDDKAKQMVDQAIEQYAEYEQQKRHFEASLDGEYDVADTELSREEWKEKTLNEWVASHDPMRALNEKFGVIGEKISDYKATQANDFLVSVPRKHIKGKSTGFYDSNFENLTEKEKEFYTFYINTISRFMGYLPNYKVRGLSRNYLPKVSMDFVEVMKKEGRKGALRYMNTRMKDSISTGVSPELVQSELNSYTEIDPSTGLPKKELLSDMAERMLSPEGMEVDELSFNIPVILRQFAGMAINFKFKSAVEDRANLAMHVMRQAKSVQKKGGKTIRDRVGNLVAAKEGVVGLTDATQYFIDAMLYGEKRDTYEASNITIFDSWNPAKNSEKRRRMKEIENLRDELEENLQARLISQEEYEEKIETLEEEYKELGGKNLVWGKVGDRFLEYTQMKGMGYNLTAGIANVGFGLLSNFTWAAGGQDFNNKQLMRAFGRVLKSTIPGRKDYKVANLIKKFDVLFEVTEVEYGTEADKRTKTSSKTYNFIANTMHPFEIQRRTEYAVQGISMLAQMYATEIEVVEKATGKKTTINLYEAFDENANWNSKYEELENWNSPSEGLVENDFTRFKNKVIQLNKYLHGNYDPNSPVKIKKYLAGRMLSQFRSWIPMGFAQRFKDEYYDRQLGRTFKGRYRTLAHLGIVDSLRGLLGAAINSDNLMSSKKGGGETFSDIDIANLKMNLRELQILIGFIAIGVAMKASLEDDDEDDWGSYSAHIIMNQLYRVEQDIYFYLSPRTFEEILKNPIPVMKTYQDFEAAFGASMDYIMDSEYEGSRLAKKWGKALPLANQFVKMDFLGTRSIRDM